MLNDALRRDLSDLRAAAHNRDQQQLQYLIKRLLGALPYFHALALAVQRVHGYLDLFESYYPAETWPRTLLLTIANYGTAPDEALLVAAIQQAWVEPGAGNYVKALHDLVQAMQTKHTPEARVGYLASSLVNSIAAELTEAWYGERPADWAALRAAQSGAGDPAEGANLALAFWLSEQTAALDVACWLEIAEALEQALGR